MRSDFLRACLLSMTATVFLSESFANEVGIYCAPPPLFDNVGDVAALKMCINNANLMGGGTIDLGGFIYTFTTFDHNDPGIGPTALPNLVTPITLKNGTLTKDPSLVFRFIRVIAPGALNLINMTLQNGNMVGFSVGGGSIRIGSGANLGLVKDSSFTNNQSDNGGGAIHIFGFGHTITNTTFASNTGNFGGAINVLQGGQLEMVSDCIFVNNMTLAGSSGGAIALTLGSKLGTIVDSTFNGNVGGFAGGAIEIQEASTMDKIERSTFSFNHTLFTGGAIHMAFGDTNQINLIRNCTFNNNAAGGNGGAIGNEAGTIVSVYNNTFNQNTGSHGGAIYVGPLGGGSAIIGQLFNNTIAGNLATSAQGGGGIYDCHLINVMDSNLVAQNLDINTTPGVPDDVFVCAPGDLPSASYNLIGIGTNTGGAFNNVGGNIGNIVGTTVPIDPHLGLLRNNGGPTFTMALLTNSPAIGAGANPLGLPFDQRGEGFARTVNAQTDIGAYQVQRTRECPCRPDRDCRPDDCRSHHEKAFPVQ